MTGLAPLQIKIGMANEKDVRELLSLQKEIDDVAIAISGLMTNETSAFSFKKSPAYFAAEDAFNTEIEKFEQVLKQELLSGSNASDKSLLYLQSVSVTALASVYRGHLGRKSFVNRRGVWMEERRLAAAKKIRKWLCMVSGMRLARARRLEIETEWKSAAATQIQRIFKGRYQTNAVRRVQTNIRTADLQFHLTRGGAYEALSKMPDKSDHRVAARSSSRSDTSTSSSEDYSDDEPVGAAGWLPGAVRFVISIDVLEISPLYFCDIFIRRNIHDETFRES